MSTILSQLATVDLETTVNTLSWNTVIIGSVALVILLFLAIVLNNRVPKAKAPLFLLILVVVASTTFTISGATVYLNLKSATGGPVHWHADVEMWACGNELEIRDPHGALSNKIGTPTLHEHNDKRIHLEGVPVALPHDASLGKFMDVIGGDISQHAMTVPVNDNGDLFEDGKNEQDGDGLGAPAPELVNTFLKTEADGRVATFTTGEFCGNQASEVQVFAYTFDEKNKTYKQTKLSDPANYAIAPHGDVPPGDCVIFEFAPAKERTDKLCKQYGIRDIDRCEQFGVKPNERKICEDKEVQ